MAQATGDELDWLAKLNTLPHGLRGYYRFFWNHFESVRRTDAAGWHEWKALYLPTLQFLVAGCEMVSVPWLAAFVERDREEIEARVLHDWRRFLRVTRDGNNREAWGVVHQSFVDYLMEEHPELDLPNTHGRIADHYLTTWGGLGQGLPGLAVPDTAAQDDGYGLRHVMHHLWRAKRYDDLCAVADAAFFAAQARYFRSYQSTFDDLKLAVRAADSLGNRVGMLGLACVHAGLKARLARLGSLEIIQLYARFGKTDLALKLTEEIADHEAQARTRVSVAREVFASDPCLSRSLIRQVLQSTAGVLSGDRREFFRLVADRWPEELVAFLEGAKSEEPFLALLDRSPELTEKPTHFMLRRLSSEWQARLRRCLEILPESPIAGRTWRIRFLQNSPRARLVGGYQHLGLGIGHRRRIGADSL